MPMPALSLETRSFRFHSFSSAHFLSLSLSRAHTHFISLAHPHKTYAMRVLILFLFIDVIFFLHCFFFIRLFHSSRNVFCRSDYTLQSFKIMYSFWNSNFFSFVDVFILYKQHFFFLIWLQVAFSIANNIVHKSVRIFMNTDNLEIIFKKKRACCLYSIDLVNYS